MTETATGFISEELRSTKQDIIHEQNFRLNEVYNTPPLDKITVFLGELNSKILEAVSEGITQRVFRL